jgi:MFS family permease
MLSFINEKSRYIFFILAFIQGFGSGAFYVFSMSIRYSIMKNYDKTIFEGWYFFSHGIAALLAPVIGGGILRLFNENFTAVVGINQFQLLFYSSIIFLLIISFMKLAKQTEMKY